MLCGDQLQVFYHVMSKIKEWVEWNILSDKKDRLPKIVNNKHKNFKPLHLTVAGGGEVEKVHLLKY